MTVLLSKILKIKNIITSFLIGEVYRTVPKKFLNEKSIFLTFDDGPNSHCTYDVLNLLKEHDVKSTFFLITKNAIDHSSITKKILDEGHSIGNHSYDHDTKTFFRGYKYILNWINQSQDKLNNLLASFNISHFPQIVGFRSPLGIRTPVLARSLKLKKFPHILWDLRFYDTQKKLKIEKIPIYFRTIQNGSIVLLHDNHKNQSKKEFLRFLEQFIKYGKKNGFTFPPLEKRFFY